MSALAEDAPQQENLEQQTLAGDQTNYGATLAAMEKLQDAGEMDKKLPPRMRAFLNDWVVATHQFDRMENPAGALTCARVLRSFLIFFIVMSTTGLIIGFVLKGKLESPIGSEQVQSAVAPSVVLCPSPWGSRFRPLIIASVDEGKTPGNHWLPTDYNLTDFNSTLGNESEAALEGCKQVEIASRLKPLGLVASYTAYDTVRVSLAAHTEDGYFYFGFTNADCPLPQRWSTASLGSRTVGQILYDQFNIGASDVSEGVPRAILGFKSMGNSPMGSSGQTQLEFFYGYFMIRVLAAQSSGITVFAVVAFMLLVAASLANCGLFDLFFLEYVPDDEPPPDLVPNMFCQVVCGKMFSSCRRRKEEGTEDAPEEANA